MNLWLRMLAYLLTTWRRESLEAPFEVSKLHYRVWPFDLDIVGHMNNGRYLTIMDLGRLDLMVRTKLWDVMMKRKWLPTVSAINVRYRREMRVWDRFRLETRILTWDDTNVLIEHSIWIESGRYAGTLSAIAIARAGIYDPKARRYVTSEELMEAIDVEAAPPALSPELREIVDGFDGVRDLARDRQAEAG